ncbi:BrnA antitoxin family protein [Rhizobium sp. NRK18]|uniref:BrnA antitoxin family protein n=1 Tax=Rhizobium sp. NRK18 TaxID=2964667 RepID=UPI0021C43BE4|nr:BrnA antitoxin family protein [Rhizobium sp. NRK18]MCQ2004526.1 BrnA antitoxin family protein [Rhizobium sp. NRK18]
MSMSAERLKQLANRSEDAIDFSDVPELDEAFFRTAKLVEPTSKKQVTMRIDANVLDWFKARGKGYQTRMNAVLKAFMESQSK